MKSKITLGLMVFFAGVLLTACGGSDSSPNAVPIATSTDDSINPAITRPVGCANPCSVNQYGYLSAIDANRFAQFTETSTGGSVSGSGSNIEPIFVDKDGDGKLDGNWSNFGGSVISTGISCAIQKYLGGSCDVSYGNSNNNTFNNLSGSTTRVPIDLQYNFIGNDNYYESVIAMFNGKRIEFFKESSGRFMSADGYYVFFPGNKMWTVASSQGDIAQAR